MAWSLDYAKQFASNPKAIPWVGASVSNISQALDQLKQGVMAGKMSVTDFQQLATPLVNTAQQITSVISSQGSKAANTVNPAWQQIQSGGYVTSSGGQWKAQLPFTQQEYAALPANVLPTQRDIQNGSFDPTTAPSQRYQDGSGNVVNTPATGVTPSTTIGPNGQPLPQINPSLPPGTNTQTNQGQIDLQGAQNAAQLQDALNKQYGVNQQAVSQLAQSLANIPGIYQQEGQNQQNQLNTLADQQKSARAQSLTDLGTVLANQQMNDFNAAIPDLSEQANTAGIYRSTGFGNILAQKYAQLTAQTQSQLAQQGLADREAYLGQQQNALNTGLGYSGQAAQAAAAGAQTVGSAGAGALQAYGAGLGDVANAQIGMQNAGLQRQFSLQDYNTQYSNALNLANQARVQGPTGKASPGTQTWLQTGMAEAQLPAKMAGKGGGGGGSGQAVPYGLSPQFGAVGTPTML